MTITNNYIVGLFLGILNCNSCFVAVLQTFLSLGDEIHTSHFHPIPPHPCGK